MPVTQPLCLMLPQTGRTVQVGTATGSLLQFQARTTKPAELPYMLKLVQVSLTALCTKANVHTLAREGSSGSTGTSV